jgi:hypothetical protein
MSPEKSNRDFKIKIIIMISTQKGGDGEREPASRNQGPTHFSARGPVQIALHVS